MLNNFRNLQSLFWSHGWRWLLFRVEYALLKRMGCLRLQMPRYQWKDHSLETWLTKSLPSTPQAYAQWRRQNSPKFFFNLAKQDPDRVSEGVYLDIAQVQVSRPWNPQTAVDEAERILSGELKYFSHAYYQAGFPPNWHKDPVFGTELDSRKHWSELSDAGEVDIKFIWEPSRFSMVYTLVRAYASTRDEKYAEAFWTLIQSWAKNNPPNTGPNWMDGQEAALRLMAWTFGFYAFLDSPSTTPERIAQLTIMVAAHAERIYRNIDYAISTHSNHTISEAFGLWLVGLLFPELKNAENYSAFGRKLLEQEAIAQLFPDGTYSMYSLNYHRFILHLYLYAMRLGELNGAPFSDTLKNRVSTSIDYLCQLIDPETGQMPVYGSNDGALVLPLNNCDFTDYRPLLQLGSYLTKKQFLFEPGPWDEDISWLCGEEFTATRAKITKENFEFRRNSFPDGGIYLLRGTNSKAIIRCTDYHARPSHADQLHVDLWIGGQNMACDAGTYLYSEKGIWRNGLAHTAVHNTVIVDRKDQMKMVSRFTWTNWSRGKVLRHDKNTWQGQHDSYKPIVHKRMVLSLHEDRWLVVDHLDDQQPHQYTLHWLFSDFPYEQKENLILLSTDSLKHKVQVGLRKGQSTFSIVRGDPNSTRGWRSLYYGAKEPAISMMLETDQQNALFWTYFGFEADEIAMTGKTLNIRSEDRYTNIDLSEINK